MAHYVDGFVLPVPRDRLDEYKRVAEAAAVIWKVWRRVFTFSTRRIFSVCICPTLHPSART